MYRAMILAVLVASAVVVSAAAASGQEGAELSPGCVDLNDPSYDGLYTSSGVFGRADWEFYPNEELVFTAGPPDSATDGGTIRLRVVAPSGGLFDSVSVSYPGTLRYTIGTPEPVMLSVDWEFDHGIPISAEATWDVSCSIPPPPPPPPPPALPDGGRFFDDDGSVHEVSIEAIAADGITKGCNPPYQTGYCPKASVTRQQMAAFLVRALGLTDTGGGNSFVDDDGSVFEDDIAKLAAAGITKGCNPPVNDRFCPTSSVTRGQMGAFLVRALGLTDSGAGDLFVDDDGSVFENDIDKLATAGVTTGCNPPANDMYCPDKPVTRAQMATFLARALQLPTVDVPKRPETINGPDIGLIPLANMVGCTGEDGEVCTVNNGFNGGEFHMLTGWFAEDWSSYTSAEMTAFRSDKLRLEATFDGVPIDLVAWPFEVVDNTAFKTYSFQFPGWLQGLHVLEVDYIDETENYLWTVRAELYLYGDGYPQTDTLAAPRPTRSPHRTATHLGAP